MEGEILGQRQLYFQYSIVCYYSSKRPCPALHWYVKSSFKKEVPDRQMTVGDFFLYNLFKGTYTITAPFLLLLQNINQTDFQRYHSTPP